MNRTEKFLLEKAYIKVQQTRLLIENMSASQNVDIKGKSADEIAQLIFKLKEGFNITFHPRNSYTNWTSVSKIIQGDEHAYIYEDNHEWLFEPKTDLSEEDIVKVATHVATSAYYEVADIHQVQNYTSPQVDPHGDDQALGEYETFDGPVSQMDPQRPQY